MPRMILKLLGQSTIEIDGHVCKFRQKRSAALLIYCVIEDKPIARDKLCDLLWPDNPSALKRLSDALSAFKSDVNRVMPDAEIENYLAINQDDIQIPPNCQCECDVQVFEGALGEIAEGDLSSNRLGRIYNLYEGPFLANFRMRSVSAEFGSWDDWQNTKRRSLEDQYLKLTRELALVYLQEGKYELATPLFLQIQAQDEEEQSSYAFLMLCYYAANQRQRAKKIYSQYTEMMQECLQSTPEIFMQNLLEEINKNNPACEPPTQLLTNMFRSPQTIEDSDLKTHIQSFIQRPLPPSIKHPTPIGSYRNIERYLKQQTGMIGTPHLFLGLCQEDPTLAENLFGKKKLQQITQAIQNQQTTQEQINGSMARTLALHNILQQAKEGIETNHTEDREIIHLWRAFFSFENILPVQTVEEYDREIPTILAKLEQFD